MVISAEKRSEKFKNKISGKIAGERTEAQKDQMIKKETKYFAESEKMQNKVKIMIDGEPTILIHYYFCFAEEILKLKKLHDGQTLLDELRILDDKWEMRGLKKQILNTIKIFYVPAYIKMVTKYWSCSGVNFIATHPDIDAIIYDETKGIVDLQGGGLSVVAPVFLPHGAVVTAVVVYGSASDETWKLKRQELNVLAVGEDMATGNVNTEDTSIAEPIINNQDYMYWLRTSVFDAGDDIYSARITYTI